ncbi:SSI family serine proteinase inhibitor [Actinokineospora pegani]|uniref:SSI family serine proteinase inhibitor n=1 Tax=Actinokineospora pegani TaxID=2654637 RepID=UPI0012E99CC7|nr:SSI family serine proteinase inhibitor [Actinokineospora pegani]
MFAIPLAMLAATAAGPATLPVVGHTGGTHLVLAVADHQDGVRTTTLRCEPPGGDHPQPQAACAALDPVAGDVTQLSSAGNMICTLQYAPIRVSAYGYWRGHKLTVTHEYSNPCLMNAETGPVFTWATTD